MVRRSVPVRKSVWGSQLWLFFHAAGYKLANIEDLALRCEKTSEMWKHTRELIQTIPCPSCRKHAASMYVATRYEDPNDEKCDWYQKWAFEFHNKVNQRLRKPVMSWEDSMKLSEALDAKKHLNEYVKAINGWKYSRVNTLVQSIQNLLESV